MPVHPKPLPPIEELERALRCDVATGILYWKHRADLEGSSRNSKWAGKPAGTVHPRGHIIVNVNGILYWAHRIVFKMVFGWEPPEVDHEDLDPSNNKPTNLRAATFAQNQRNKTANRNNVLGKKGVYLDRRRNRYVASIMKDRKKMHLGEFDTPEAAHRAYAAAAARLHGKFARS